MALVDHTFPVDREIRADGFEDGDLLSQLKQKLPIVSYEKIIRIVDEAVDSVAESGLRLVLPWACTGSLFGHDSKRPHNDVEYIWGKVIDIVGPEKFCKMAIGALLQWRIAFRAEERDEDWHAYRTEYDEVDPDTGKKITRYEYWMTISN